MAEFLHSGTGVVNILYFIILLILMWTGNDIAKEVHINNFPFPYFRCLTASCSLLFYRENKLGSSFIRPC